MLAKMEVLKAKRRNMVNGDGKPKLWTARLCPFAERILFAFNLLGVEYEQEEIDLKNKPEHFLKVAPLGKVPVVEDLGSIINESMVIVEYVDEVWESPNGRRLYPESPLIKALAKATVEFINSTLTPRVYKCLYAFTDDQMAECTTATLGILADINKKMNEFSVEGPFFLGKEPTFVDIALMPHVRRLLVISPVIGFEIPKTSDYQRFLKWMDTCLNLPSYKIITNDITGDELAGVMKRNREIRKQTLSVNK